VADRDSETHMVTNRDTATLTVLGAD